GIGLVHRTLPDGRFFACLGNHRDTIPHLLTYCRCCRQAQELTLSMESQQELASVLQTVMSFSELTLHVEGVCQNCRVNAEVTPVSALANEAL
ncbi:hypothetical protein RZS08_31900, partial [Arthrospira platensis SPKY1]|nr:hypothetical protein [Arthrospira platensis SPKY1]